MRASLLLLLLMAMPAVPAGATCPLVDGVCMFDGVQGDPECVDETSQGQGDTGAYADAEDAHAGAYGHRGCGRGASDKDADGPYYEDRARTVVLYATGPAGGVVLVWGEHESRADGETYARSCYVAAYLHDGSPDAPHVEAPCPSPPPGAPWGALLP